MTSSRYRIHDTDLLRVLSLSSDTCILLKKLHLYGIFIVASPEFRLLIRYFLATVKNECFLSDPNRLSVYELRYELYYYIFGLRLYSYVDRS